MKGGRNDVTQFHTIHVDKTPNKESNKNQGRFQADVNIDLHNTGFKICKRKMALQMLYEWVYAFNTCLGLNYTLHF